MTMIEPKADLPKIQVKEFFGDTSIGIEPVFCVAPKALDPVDVVPSLGSATFFAHHNVFSPDPQRGIGLPVVSIVQTARSGMLPHQGDNLLARPRMHRKHSDHAVSLQDAKDHNFAGSTPAPLAMPNPAKHRLVTFHGPVKGLPPLLLYGTTGTDQTIEPLYRRQTGYLPKPLTVDRNPQHKQLKESSLRLVREPARLPDRAPRVPMSAALALIPAVRKLIRFPCTTFFTRFHSQTSVTLVRFG